MANKMVLYYNTERQIVCITPKEDEQFSQHNFIYVDISEVEDFIMGKKSMNNYRIQDDILNPTIKTIKQKKAEVDFLRSQDFYLTEIKKECVTDYSIQIVYNKTRKNIYFQMSEYFKKEIIKNEAPNMEGAITFNGSTFAFFYFTVKNNPYYLVESFKIEYRRLFLEDKVYLETKEDLSDCSLFTKKFFVNASFLEKE